MLAEDRERASHPDDQTEALGRGFGVGLLGLAQRLHRLAALLAARAVEDQDPVQVVHLVEDHSRLEARVIQHEMDHLDGVLILDRTSREQRREAMKALREAEQSEAAA